MTITKLRVFAFAVIVVVTIAQGITYAQSISGDVSSFQSGRNILKTGKTPLNKKGKMVHGMEVNWPGIMVLIQYKEQTNEHQGNN